MRTVVDEAKDQARIQVIKGLLPLAVLGILKQKDTYGYEVQKELQKAGFRPLSEPAVYSTLKRLYESGELISYMAPSGDGPNRKYYGISKKGLEKLETTKTIWKEINISINKILKEKNER